MFQRPLRQAFLLLIGFAAASPVLALGFGRIPESIPFGQPLDLSVPLRLDGGAPPGCLQAQVRIGEQRLPPRSVRLQLEGGDPARLRIRSATVVHEPMVAVQLTIGCRGPVSRQFVVFADPASQPAVARTEAAPAAAERRPPAPAPQPSRRADAAPSVHEPAAPPQRRTAEGAARSGASEPAAAAAVDATAWAAALHAARAEAQAAASAASAAERRLVAMNADLERLREEAASQRALVAQMRTRLAQAGDGGRALPALIAFVVSLGLVGLWLGWRMHGLRRGRVHSQEPAGPPPTGAAVRPVVPPMPPVPPAATPMVVAAEATHGAGVDALIDLEQEVEFFELLGDEPAAVDLLRAHLRSGSDASPLPCLQLLRLHHRHGDRAAFEQVGQDYGRRFGTPAPAWGAGAEPGRELQDCAALLAELQARWASPAQALAWLEQRLFSAPGSEQPGLSAYKDLLTLAAVARDLHRQAGAADAGVDLLLPLAGREEAAATLRPSIFDTLQPLGAAAQAAVDVDLGEPTTRP